MFRTVLTPNRRLAATLQKIYNNQHVTDGEASWRTLDILPINTWLQKTWKDYTHRYNEALQLLTPSQEKLCWEKIIRQTPSYSHLLRLSETAEKVCSAYHLLKQWCVKINHPLFDQAEDYIALKSWIHEFDSLCERSHWISEACLPDILAEKIELGLVTPPQNISLYGFTDVSPQLKKLFSYFPSEPVDLTLPSPYEGRHQACSIALKDSEHELLTMARWVKTIYMKNNDAKIGCVIPNLDKNRDRVVQVFTDVLSNATIFNVSAGRSLAHFPAIKTALQLLSLNNKPISHQLMNELLSSPFLGEAEQEKLQRYRLDVKLRKENVYSIQLNSSLLNACPHLQQRIQKFIGLLDGKKRSYHDWTLRFTDMLITLGWPGERSLNSEEYQTIDAWMSLLNEFSSLDYTDQPVHLNEAVSTLKRMASTKQFQPESPEASIQVLGLLEAASIPFDYLWVTSMNDTSWPQQPKPNPFIPKSLQRELKMPHSTAERELTFSTNITEQFKKSASLVIFSYPEWHDDMALQISPLIRDLQEVTEETLELEDYQSISERLYACKQLESIDDHVAPALTDFKVTGGIDVLKQQALCPFKAFSTHRLYARDLESPLPGLKSKDRGRIIHKVLELVWASLKNHDTLVNTDENVLKNLISTSIDKVLASLHTTHLKRSNYVNLEKARLQRLMSDWLDIEKLREPFEVLSQEEMNVIQVGQLHFSVRIDRVDQLSPGQKLIIDYKTGKNNPITPWFEERIEEPQLPVYSLLDPTSTTGISYAQITSDEKCFKGVSQVDVGVDGIKIIPDWNEQLVLWKNRLEALSDEFSRGYAATQPKDSDKTCEWCQLQSFCRINEHG